MADIDKYYDIFGLQPGATEAEVKQAYKDLIQVWHPDRFAHNPRVQKQAEEKTKEINAAYREIIKHLKEQKAQASTEQNNESSKKQDGGLYNVLFNGEILPGFNDIKVKQDICDLFKIEPSSFKGKRIFENKTLTMKVGVGINDAEQYKALMNEFGAVCIIVPVGNDNKEQDRYKNNQRGNEKQEDNKDKDYQNKTSEDTKKQEEQRETESHPIKGLWNTKPQVIAITAIVIITLMLFAVQSFTGYSSYEECVVKEMQKFGSNAGDNKSFVHRYCSKYRKN